MKLLQTSNYGDRKLKGKQFIVYTQDKLVHIILTFTTTVNAILVQFPSTVLYRRKRCRLSCFFLSKLVFTCCLSQLILLVSIQRVTSWAYGILWPLKDIHVLGDCVRSCKWLKAHSNEHLFFKCVFQHFLSISGAYNVFCNGSKGLWQNQ